MDPGDDLGPGRDPEGGGLTDVAGPVADRAALRPKIDGGRTVAEGSIRAIPPRDVTDLMLRLCSSGRPEPPETGRGGRRRADPGGLEPTIRFSG
jgi:hypothetical protein